MPSKGAALRSFAFRSERPAAEKRQGTLVILLRLAQVARGARPLGVNLPFGLLPARNGLRQKTLHVGHLRQRRVGLLRQLGVGQACEKLPLANGAPLAHAPLPDPAASLP